jgi:biopolymer transport protein ExbB
MKTSLFICLCTLALTFSSLGQNPPPAPAGAPQQAVTPAQPAMPGQPGMPAPPPAVGMSPGTAPGMSPGAPGTSPLGAMPSPGQSVAVTLSPSPAATAAESATPSGHLYETKVTGNYVIDKFNQGGPIMWPILIVSIVALTVVIERIFWWMGRWFRRDPKRIEKVFTAVENNDIAEASRLSRGSRDPVLRILWNGLNHQHASLQGALQVSAGIEIKRAGRFLVVMDTLVTLAPLLGLLGTVTGLIRAFGALGNEEIAVVAVTGGIAEALIATACGLGIAIFALIPFNFFTSRVSNLEFELQTAATNLEVMLGSQSAAREMDITSGAAPSGKGSSI